MKKITTVAEFVERKVAPEHRAIVANLRRLMNRYAPDATEGIIYGIIGWKQKRLVAVINPTKSAITFAFSGGASFTDKHGLLRGVGKVSKHVKFEAVADIKTAPLRDYIKQAVAFATR